MDPIATMQQLGLVPVCEVPDAATAVRLAGALLDAGLPCAEITFRTAAAEEAIRRISAECADVLVGAGTVRSVEQVDRAIDAGARFVVTPGFNSPVVEHCLARGVPVLPGICTPTELEMALARGISIVKFFPAEASGGTKYLKAIRAPYPDVRFVPTGGIDPDNLADYLGVPGVVACGGSWMVKKDLLAAGDFQAVRRLTVEAVALVARVRGSGGTPASATAP
jgi:2-dehydro-3-deoxyphosphogluconate aldolase / (4S)-4-hydroxy-2-oxoglutarate aldolase